MRGARLAGPALALMVASSPAQAAGLGEEQVRGFVARQEAAWNRGDLAGYFAGFTRDAVFADQYRTPSGVVVPYGQSSLIQARAQSRRSRASAQISETSRVMRIGRSISRPLSSAIKRRTELLPMSMAATVDTLTLLARRCAAASRAP